MASHLLDSDPLAVDHLDFVPGVGLVVELLDETVSVFVGRDVDEGLRGVGGKVSRRVLDDLLQTRVAVHVETREQEALLRQPFLALAAHKRILEPLVFFEYSFNRLSFTHFILFFFVSGR